MEVPAGTGTNRFCPGKRHEHGSSPVTITSFLIHDHEPRTRVDDKTKSHGLFVGIILFKTVHYWTVILRESAYANSLKGMGIHRDGSLAHAIGESPLVLWRRSNGVYMTNTNQPVA